jgi:DNA polymerase-4
MATLRKIVHVDMDAFFASVEQRDHPEWRGKPLVVGGRPEERGAVAAASYEARRFGIHSAMPSRTAVRLCPELVFAPLRLAVYREVSAQIRAIFHSFTDLVEPVALDEAYLDVTENRAGLPYATTVARAIKAEIFQQTGLTASAGVSYNKFCAKLATGLQKPDGLTVILPEGAQSIIEALPVERFWGVGPATAERMHALGIRTGADLARVEEAVLVQQFGKHGHFFYRMARAQDDRPVVPNRPLRSLAAETSFLKDLSDEGELSAQLFRLCEQLEKRRGEQQVVGRTLTVRLKFADGSARSKSRTVVGSLAGLPVLEALAGELFRSMARDGPVRLLGLTLANLAAGKPSEATEQLHLSL